MSFQLKLNFHKRSIQINELKETSTFSELQQLVLEKTGIAIDQQKFFMGYPLQQLFGKKTDHLRQLGITTRSLITLQEQHTSRGQQSTCLQNPNQNKIPLSTTRENNTRMEGTFIRRIMDADNSCLFYAVGYIVGKLEFPSQFLRQVIVNTIQKNPNQYTTVVLGKTPEEYCQWILHPDSWGGEIELSILASHFQIELVVLDIMTLNQYPYGSELGLTQRGFLIYDGIHYDAVALTPMEGAPKQVDITLFPVAEDIHLQSAMKLIQELHDKQQYTNLSGFSIKCLVCNQGLRGQADIQKHANQTGHTNFSEIHDDTNKN